MFKELKREAYEANVALPRHGLINLTFGNASAIDRARARIRDQAERGRLCGADAGRHGRHRPRGTQGRRSAQPVLGHADPPQAVPGLSEHRRRGPHPFVACDRLRPGRPADPDIRHDPRRLFQWRGAGHPQDEASEIATDYEWETGNVIVETMRNRDPADFPGVLVNRHAPFTWGPSVAKALENAVAVECIAQMALMSLQLAPDLAPIEEELLNKHFRAQAWRGRLLRADPGLLKGLRKELGGRGLGLWTSAAWTPLTSPFPAISRGCGADLRVTRSPGSARTLSTYVYMSL